MSAAGKEKLITDVKVVLNDAEDLLRQAAASTGDRAVELRERALGSLKRAKETLYDVQDSVYERSKVAARATDDFVHENPWRAIGVAAAIGFLAGLLVNSRR
ncbi:YqjD family protein [Pigmentiphaga soli]|uniref:YqjD family protein n=1 Tax=Pigmentiphaga soli TaxID=1007095 RepID=A0ABP8GT12_9BURK